MISIKLDTHAVQSIFPAGSEARVELQQSVINNVVQELVLYNSKNKVKETVGKEISLVGARLPDVKPLVQEELRKFFTTKGWNDIECSTELSTRMKTAAQELATLTVNRKVQELIDESMDTLQTKIKSMLDYSEVKMEQLIEQSLTKKFNSALDKAIAARLEQVFPVTAK